MNTAHDPFAQTLASYQAAVLAKDTDAFMALYTEDIQIFDMWGAWSLQGSESWRKLVSDWFSGLGTESVVVSVRDAHSNLSGELAVGHAIITYTAVSAQGEKLRSLSSRLTMALRRVDNSWRIFHEHTSAPIDHHSLKAILEYKGEA